MDYVIRLIKKIDFNIRITNFSSVAYWIDRIIIGVLTFSGNPHLLMRRSRIMNISSLVFSSSFKFLRRLIQPIDFSITLSSTIKQLWRQISTFNISSISLNSIKLSMLLRIDRLTSVSVGGISIVGTPQVEKFYPLSEWDDDTLTTLDIKKLEDMDFQ